MRKNEKSILSKRRVVIIDELKDLDGLIVGSFFERKARGVRRFCLSRMHGKKQRQIYVPAEIADAVRRGVRKYQRTLELIKELGEINLKLLKEEHETNADAKS